MMTPGFLYMTGALLLFLPLNNKTRYLLSILITAGALMVTFSLHPGDRLQLDFLKYTLIPLEVDPISKLTGLVFAVGGVAAVTYSNFISAFGSLRLIFVFIGSALTVVFSGDLFTLYIFWELMTISSSLLIITANDETKRTGYYYFLMHLAGSLCLLWGIFIQYSATGRLSLNAIEAGIPFFIIAIAVKLAFVGFHTWMPLVYSKAPFYVAVVLSIYTTKVGVYVMSVLVPDIHWLAYAGLISALFGIIMALRQTQIRKLLSYSIIIQVGYMIIGISVGTTEGTTGAVFHLVNHILYKTVLFMAAGVVIYTTGKDHLENLGVLGRRLPITSVATWIAFLGIAGVPFFNGYMSKTIIKEAIQEPLLTWGLNVMSFGTCLLFLKFMYYAFFKGRTIPLQKKPTISMQAGLVFLTLMMIVVGIHPTVLENVTSMTVDIHYFDTKHMVSGVQPFLWSIPFFILFKQYFLKDPKRLPYFDIYPIIGNVFVFIGYKLSHYHDGNLNRYWLWATTTLIILWLLMI
ncbi:proton-conducting transporter membrane subunit [Halobacillus sp. HZG1]|uniref:proton-conducting transporter transmembrane domain-containing protein n=1 Tax=Halobacillus sp. HZG1 TaxID=3111769 RepID=UPI002DBBFA1B|nr:proton-conducting transporter membrane subunit [Halobacillus sp. HZG1]MEC3884942.1 proton-conducting transporter membrane subunit [Halobacillus sp. HZG1]